MNWQADLVGRLRAGLGEAEGQFDRWKHRVRERLGRIGPPVIVPYRGFGTRSQAVLEGRVLEDKGLERPKPDDHWLENITAMYHRFESDELPGIPLAATLGSQTARVTSDAEGYFRVQFQLEELLPDERWHDVHLRLETDETASETQEKIWATGTILTPSADAEFGIISDIDDTVLQSYVTDWLRMARVALLRNASTRLPFDGVAQFYQALVGGSDGKQDNPVFYVSSSSWNLYDLLVDFLDIQEIPPGPLLLRDIGLDKSRFLTGGHGHKGDKIDRILDTYPGLPFVLIGDSGQRDPELYREAVDRHPGRIREIYIRDVVPDHRESVEEIISDSAGQGIEMLLVSDTAAAAEHARQRGLITNEAMQRVVEHVHVAN